MAQPLKHELVEDYQRIRVSDFGKPFLLPTGRFGRILPEGFVRRKIVFEIDPEAMTLDMQVDGTDRIVRVLFTTTVTWRGERVMFLCPGCSGRRMFLYWAKDGNFLCSDCLDLNWYSRRVSDPLLKAFWRHDQIMKKAATVGVVARNGKPTKKVRQILKRVKKLKVGFRSRVKLDL